MKENQIKPDPDLAKKKNIETLAGDMVEVIKKNQDGEIRKIIQEQEEREVEITNLSPQSKKNRFFMITSGVLMTLAVALVALYMVFLHKKNTVPVAGQFRPIIFTEKTAFADITGLDKEKISKSVFKEATNAVLGIEEVEGIYPAVDKKVIGLKDFLVFLKTNVVLDGINDSDNFLLGITTSKKSANTVSSANVFMLFRADLFLNAFNSMRTWEDKMFFDLHDLFGVELNKETSFLLTKNFEDGIVQNKNARILYDNEGKVVLMYVFIDDEYVLLTNSEDATRQVILRLKSSRVGK